MARKNKMKNVPIKSAADLVDLVNHNTDVFDNALRKLGRKNRRLGVISAVAVVFAVCTAAECRRQDDELYKLSVRVQKLENKEGE